jgi:HSP20 family protein
MANLTRYGFFDDAFGDLMKGFMIRPIGFEAPAELKIRLDVNETDKAYKVRADIPGVKKEEIKVSVEGGMVSISAEVQKRSEEKKDGKLLRSERYEGMVSRSFQLPQDVDAAGAQASYKDGVLDLVLPKKAGAATKQITVN